MVGTAITLVVVLIPTFIVLLVITLYVYYNTPNSYTILFDQATSYLFDGKLVSTNKESTHKILPLDKHYDIIQTILSSSDLTEATVKRMIHSDNVKFNNAILLSLENMSTSTGPQEVNVTFPLDNPGLYHGAIQRLLFQ